MEQSSKPPIAAEAHLGLVRLCANRFRERGIEYDELYSAGWLGNLLRNSVNYTPEGGSIRIGRRLQELSLRANRIAAQLRQQNGAEPTVRQIADALGISEAETAEALCAAQPVSSLTAETDEGEVCTDIPVPSPETQIQEHLALEQVLSLLNDRDRELIRLRYTENMTQTATAAMLGMTQVQVSRREKKILLFLRGELLK